MPIRCFLLHTVHAQARHLQSFTLFWPSIVLAWRCQWTRGDGTVVEERVPQLYEMLHAARGRLDILLDLKEQGEHFDAQVAAAIREHGDPERTIVGVRSLRQAQRFRQELLPAARQLGLVPAASGAVRPGPEEGAIAAFVAAGVDKIRLWDHWIEADPSLVKYVHSLGVGLHLNGKNGTESELRELLAHGPTSVSADDPKELVKNLRRLAPSPAL